MRIPALREPRQEIPLLITQFIERMVRNSGQEKMLSDDALKALLAYDWPGNVRKLENCLERTYAFTSGPLIHTTDLPPRSPRCGGTELNNGNGHSDGKPQITPMAELEKQTILSTIPS